MRHLSTTIGQGSWVRSGSTLTDTRVGEGVFIGFRTRITNASLGAHCMVGTLSQLGARRAEPVVVEDGAWISVRTRIAPGVRIGADCVVGAGAWVDQDVPPGAIVIGRPARVLRQRGPAEEDGRTDIGPILTAVAARRDLFAAPIPAGWTVGDGCLLDADLTGGQDVVLGSNIIMLGRPSGPSAAGGVRLGDHTAIGDGAVLEASGGVSAGPGTTIGRGALIVSSTHDLRFRSLPWLAAPVAIGAGCRIGDNATLVGPLLIGDHAIVPAGAVIVADVPAGSTGRDALAQSREIKR